MVLTTSNVLWGFLTALPITLMSVASCVSYAQLLSVGSLSIGFLASASFFSAGCSNLVINAFSNMPFLVSAPDMTFTLYLQSVQVHVLAAAQEDSEQVQMTTALVALHLSSALLGGVFIALGKLRIVAALSYLPYPVIAGFLAMIGAAVINGALKILTSGTHTSSEIPGLVIAIGFAACILTLKQHGVPTNISSPTLIIISIAFFYSWAWITNRSLQDLADHGWVSPASGNASNNPLHIFDIDWRFVHPWKVLPGFDALALVLVASINRALTVSAVESSLSDEPYSVDAEMSSIGTATVLGSLLGGVAMNPTSAMTALCKEGARSEKLTGRCAVVIGSMIHLVLWVSGFPLTNYLPKFILGGLLIVMGGGMLVDWAILVARRLQLNGRIVIVAMVLVSICSNMTVGIALGTALALGFVITRFAKLEVLKYHVSGVHFRSGEQYSDRQRDILRKYGIATQIIGLTGFVFEGVAISLAKYMKHIVKRSDEIQTLVVDCTACQGINDSACFHLTKVAQMCEASKVRLVFCNLNPCDEDLLRSWKIESGNCQVVSSLTGALETAEYETLAESNVPCICPAVQSSDGESEKTALKTWLGEEAAAELLSVASIQTVKEGEELSKANSLARYVFVAVPGHSDVQVEVQTGTQNRPAVLLRTKLGAICATEALIGSHCRGTWRAQTASVCVLVEVQKLRSAPKAFAELLSRGLHQQLQESDQLSALYTLSKGGGWRGVTFDASVKQRETSKALEGMGPRLRRSHSLRRKSSKCLDNRPRLSTLEEDLLDPDDRAVGAILDFQRFVSPMGFSKMISMDSDEGFMSEETSDTDEDGNLVLNRYSVARRKNNEKTPPNVRDLFLQVEEDERAKGGQCIT